MARIADKHGLTNKYRADGIKRSVKRGRPSKYLLKSSTRKTNLEQKNSAQNFNTSPEINAKFGFLAIAIIAIILFLIIGTSACSSSNDEKYIDYSFLTQEGHPRIYDEYNAVSNYYKDYKNASVGSYQSHPAVKEPVVTALSYLKYDRIYQIILNLNNLENNFSFDETISIALDYVPVDMILENYNFQKAIYKTKSDGKKQYECYYSVKEDGVEKPGYYYDGNTWVELKSGFSLVIEETLDDSYIVKIGDNRYDHVYSALTIGWDETMEKEKATHKKWDFKIEDYTASK